jgi:hypothetical protein
LATAEMCSKGERRDIDKLETWFLTEEAGMLLRKLQMSEERTRVME